MFANVQPFFAWYSHILSVLAGGLLISGLRDVLTSGLRLIDSALVLLAVTACSILFDWDLVIDVNNQGSSRYV